MFVDRLQPRRVRRTPSHSPSETSLITCSLCLRVRRGSEWMEAEHVIGEIRSYDLDAAPRLRPAICDACAEAIVSRRAEERERAAA
jgi:hypothetical protein